MPYRSSIKDGASLMEMAEMSYSDGHNDGYVKGDEDGYIRGKCEAYNQIMETVLNAIGRTGSGGRK